MNEELTTNRTEHAGSKPALLRGTASTDGVRGRLLVLFDRLEKMGPEVLTTESRQELEALRRKFQESRFYLVFLGQFKRGKTTLLNCFIGADLLPTGVLPLTSIVTIVKFGAKPGARVNFKDGQFKDIVPANLPAYVTERGNPRNKKGVSEVEVFYPSPRLKDGLCLVDTPGIGSIFEHNTQVAYQFVPRADVGIFVFSPESPLSQTELEFLHHLRAHVQKIFFVLNKADQVTDAERTEILDFARQAIREQMPSGDLRLFPVSARQGLAGQRAAGPDVLETSEIPQLLKSLDEFLAGHKGDVLARSTGAALQRLVRDELLGLELEERVRLMDADQVKTKIQTIEKTWETLDQRHREVGYVLRGEMRELETRLEKKLNDFVDAEAGRLTQQMRNCVVEHSMAPKKELARAVDQELRGRIAEILGDWKVEEEQEVGQAFETLTSRFSGQATAVVEQIQQAAAEQFGFSWAATTLPDRLTTESIFRVRVDDIVTWGLGRFPLLLSRKLFGHYLVKRMPQICLEELDRNAGRLRADLGDRLEKSAHDYLRALDRHVEGARESVRGALNRATALQQGSEERIREATAMHQSRLQSLKSIDAEVAALLGDGNTRAA